MSTREDDILKRIHARASRVRDSLAVNESTAVAAPQAEVGVLPTAIVRPPAETPTLPPIVVTKRQEAMRSLPTAVVTREQPPTLPAAVVTRRGSQSLPANVAHPPVRTVVSERDALPPAAALALQSREDIDATPGGPSLLPTNWASPPGRVMQDRAQQTLRERIRRVIQPVASLADQDVEPDVVNTGRFTSASNPIDQRLAAIANVPQAGARRGILDGLLSTGHSLPDARQFGLGAIERKTDGSLIYRSPHKWSDGKQATYRLDSLPEEVLAGRKTIDQWENEVTSRLPSDFSPAARSVNRDLTSLEPDAANKIRALMRYAQQHGYHVEVAEARRTQERQEYLFNHGRSRHFPGGIRTWTMTSNHRDGHAVDMIVNNDRSGSDEGYAWLQEAAKRFGLEGIGPADPGHIQVSRGTR